MWLTASNALDRSIDAATVRKGGLGWLKPVAIWFTIGRSGGGGAVGSETMLAVGNWEGF